MHLPHMHTVPQCVANICWATKIWSKCWFASVIDWIVFLTYSTHRRPAAWKTSAPVSCPLPVPPYPSTPICLFSQTLTDDWLSGVKGSWIHGSHFQPFVEYRDSLCRKFGLCASAAWRRWTKRNVCQHHCGPNSENRVSNLCCCCTSLKNKVKYSLSSPINL